jgi:hypothetical protein
VKYLLLRSLRAITLSSGLATPGPITTLAEDVTVVVVGAIDLGGAPMNVVLFNGARYAVFEQDLQEFAEPVPGPIYIPPDSSLRKPVRRDDSARLPAVTPGISRTTGTY